MEIYYDNHITITNTPQEKSGRIVYSQNLQNYHLLQEITKYQLGN